MISTVIDCVLDESTGFKTSAENGSISQLVAVGVKVGVTSGMEVGIEVSVDKIAMVGLGTIAPAVSLASAVSVASIGILAIALSDAPLIIAPIKVMIATKRSTNADGVRRIFLMASIVASF